MIAKLAATGICLLTSAAILGADADALVAKLGSPRYADREAASTALSKLGERAIPLLRDARLDLDPEVKSRAEILIDSIERELLTRAVPVRLGEEVKTLGDVVEAVAVSQGVNVRLDVGAASSQRPFSSKADEHLTFWQLMDRIGLTPKWELDPMFGTKSFSRAGAVSLVRRDEKGLPVLDSGPFRLIAQPSLIMNAQNFLGDGGFRQPGIMRAPRPNREQELVIPLQILAEPRLTLRTLEAVRILEAVDEDGNNFNASPQATIDAVMNSGFRERAGAVLSVQVRLQPGANSSRTLRRLKGVIPIIVESRKSEPTVIPLNPSVSEFRPVPCGGTSILVHSVRPGANGAGGYEVEVSFRQEGLKLQGRVGRMPNRRLQELLPDSDPIWQNLEIVDSSGQPFTIDEQESMGPLAADGEVRKRITLIPRAASSTPPSELRVYGQIQATMDLAFEFRDLPLP